MHHKLQPLRQLNLKRKLLHKLSRFLPPLKLMLLQTSKATNSANLI